MGFEFVDSDHFCISKVEEETWPIVYAGEGEEHMSIALRLYPLPSDEKFENLTLHVILHSEESRNKTIGVNHSNTTQSIQS